MAQASQEEHNQQPGAITVVDDGDKDKDKELEEMKKLLAAKDAEIAALKEKDAKPNDDKSTADGDDDDDESKVPPKTDVCPLSSNVYLCTVCMLHPNVPCITTLNPGDIVDSWYSGV